MKRKFLVVFFFIIFSLTLFSQSDRNIDKNKSIDLIFYVQDKLTFKNDNQEINDLYYTNELNFDIIFKKKFYTFDFYINNIFCFNFLPVVYPNYYLPYQFSYENIEVAGLNKFRIKTYIDIYLNFYLTFYIPFDDYLSIYLTIENELKGNYYIGIFWSNRVAFIPQFQPQIQRLGNSIEDEVILGYEFFRFYGPKKFRVAIQVGNYFNSTFTETFSFLNKLKTGTYLTFFKFMKFHAYFILIDKYIDSYLYENSLGVDIIFEFYKKYFSFSLEYMGTVNTLSEYNWNNFIEVYFRFIISN